ncbi:MAG: AAA family ATPase, partial [Deltaproteobacteria bacterium]
MARVRCSVCDTQFTPRFSYQRDQDRFFCSLACRTPELEASKPKTCSHCGNTFEVRFAYQVIAKRDERRLVCSELCRAAALAEVQRATKRTRVLAVLNQKGGTGKTTTSVSVAAGLARRGRRVLLVDLDAQANSGISLGVRSDTTLYHVLAEDRPVREAIVAARRDLDLLASDQS